MRLSHLSVFVITSLMSCLPAAAQQLISAKSGLIHYTEGDVKVGVQAAAPNNGVFQSLANGKELVTAEGRAEMLLGPGQFVRLNENSSVRMVSNKLEATQIDVLSGSVLIELVEVEKNAPVTIGAGANTIELRKAGLYRIDAAESRLRVLDGEAIIRGSGQTLTAKKAKEVSMGAVLAENGFDVSAGDEFTRWAQRRAGYIATANVSGARDIYANGQKWNSSDWAFNPWYGMYTYVPYRRMSLSPFGFHYFTPDMAFNDMFWPFLGGGYGFYGMGFGYGYGSPYGFGYGSGYGYGYGSGYGYGGNTGGYVIGGGGGGGGRGTPNRPGTPIGHRPDAFGPRGTGVTNAYGNSGGTTNSGGPAMVRGGGGYTPSRGGDSSGGSSRGGGGYNSVSGGGHAGGGSYSGGGGHSSAGAASSSGGGGSVSSAPAGGGASSAGASAGGRSK